MSSAKLEIGRKRVPKTEKEGGFGIFERAACVGVTSRGHAEGLVGADRCAAQAGYRCDNTSVLLILNEL